MFYCRNCNVIANQEEKIHQDFLGKIWLPLMADEDKKKAQLNELMKNG